MTRRQFLREKEAAQLLAEFEQKFKIDVKDLFDSRKPGVEVAEFSGGLVYFVGGKAVMAKTKEGLIPTLLFEKALAGLPRITVNMGAVPHICNGADVLAPGVVRIDGVFDANDYVVVVDERFRKSLAVARALMNSKALGGVSRGKVAENVHYVGDVLWNALRKE